MKAILHQARARVDRPGPRVDSKLRGCDLVALRVDDVRPTAMPSTGRLSGRGRPDDRFGLSWPS
jgi:hypothetical protein